MYIFIGMAVVLLFMNLLFTKVTLAYWGHEHLASLYNSCRKMARFFKKLEISGSI